MLQTEDFFRRQANKNDYWPSENPRKHPFKYHNLAKLYYWLKQSPRVKAREISKTDYQKRLIKWPFQQYILDNKDKLVTQDSIGKQYVLAFSTDFPLQSVTIR